MLIVKRPALLLLLLISLLFHDKSHGQDINDTFETIDIFHPKNIKKTFTDLSSVKSFSLDQFQNAATQTLDDFLSRNSSVFIKKMGVNSLTTLSFRGASSSQSLVLWEGMPIQNTMNGATDISLFNAGLFDKIDIEYDGNSSLYGTGNVGGALHLSSSFSDRKNFRTHAGLSTGSFSNYSAYSKSSFHLSENKFYLKWSGHTGTNNFPYRYRDERYKLTNASHRSMSVLAGWENENVFSGSSSAPATTISYHVWWQNNERGIPPAFFESSSVKDQSESSLRHNLRVTSRALPNALLYLHSSWLHDIHRYRDSLSFIDQHLAADNVYNELGIKNSEEITLGPLGTEYLLFAPVQYHSLKNHRDGDLYTNSTTGLAGIVQFNFKKRLYLQLNARREINKNHSVPFLYGVKPAYHFPTFSTGRWLHNIHLFYSFQKSFRAPLLHELHQFPGGNPALKPEYGNNSEAGVKSLHSSADHRYSLRTQVVYFDRYINDWIYWLGASIWTPYNISKVRSHGWDIQIQNKYFMNSGLAVYLNLDHNYTIATTAESQIMNNNSIGRQIPYTPRYSTRINTGITFQNWIYNLNIGYTGYVFTTLDESSYLKPYTLVNSSLDFPLVSRTKYRLAGSFGVNNIFDTEYFTIHNRPMPGRHFTFSLHLIPE